jgi:hypothetical protein
MFDPVKPPEELLKWIEEHYPHQLVQGEQWRRCQPSLEEMPGLREAFAQAKAVHDAAQAAYEPIKGKKGAAAKREEMEAASKTLEMRRRQLSARVEPGVRWIAGTRGDVRQDFGYG